MTTKWHFSDWETFWDSCGETPEAVLLTTFTLDTDFLTRSLIPRLFDMNEEEGTLQWFAAIERHLPRVAVFVDAGHWQQARNRSEKQLFESAGGSVYPVRVQAGIQHSKLWMLKFSDRVRIAIGSCNLTENGFSHQIQCLWIADLKLDSYKEEQTATLQKFLRSLANAIRLPVKRESAKKLVDDWQKHIEKCSWPAGVSLIPVIPSSKNNALTGVKDALNRMKLNRPNNFRYDLHAQVFECGHLKKEWLEGLRDSFYANSFRLYWPKRGNNGLPTHPAWTNMVLPKSALKSIIDDDCCSIAELSFGKNVEQSEDRCPHGKIIAGWDPHPQRRYYAFLVLGSSNLSSAAWSNNLEMNILVKEPSGVIFSDKNKKLEAKDVYVSKDPIYEAVCKIDLSAVWSNSDIIIEFSVPDNWQQIALNLLDSEKNTIAEVNIKLELKTHSSIHKFENPPIHSGVALLERR